MIPRHSYFATNLNLRSDKDRKNNRKEKIEKAPQGLDK